jgi:hypothetical protein
MSSKMSRNPTQLKKIVYLLAATILGILLGIIVHAFIEINYIQWVLRNDHIISFHHLAARRPIIQSIFAIGGAFIGFSLGRSWWQMVYVENCRFFGKRKKRK